jgi:hypothetical protein
MADGGAFFFLQRDCSYNGLSEHLECDRSAVYLTADAQNGHEVDINGDLCPSNVPPSLSCTKPETDRGPELSGGQLIDVHWAMSDGGQFRVSRGMIARLDAGGQTLWSRAIDSTLQMPVHEAMMANRLFLTDNQDLVVLVDTLNGDIVVTRSLSEL